MRVALTIAFVVASLGVFCDSQAGANSASDKSFNNIVIGTGCASTCVDGHCEKTCNGAGEDSDASEKYFNIEGFDKINVDGLDTVIEYGSDFQVKLTDAEKSINQISIEVSDGLLRVSLPENYQSPFNARLEIVMPTIKHLEAQGNANIVLSYFDLPKLDVKLSGNVNVKGLGNRFQSILVRADQNSDGDFMQSKAGSADVNLSGNVTIALNFETQSETKLVGSVDGLSDLLYCGQPEQSLAIADTADVSSVTCE